MSTKILFPFVFGAVWCLQAFAQGIDIPGASSEEGEQKNAAAEQAATIPDPVDLSPDWWRYFEATGTALEQNIETLFARLDELEKNLPPEITDGAAPNLGRLRINLAALPEARTQTTPPPPQSPTYQQTYSLKQFLEKTQDLREAHIELRQDRDDVTRVRKAIKAAEQRLDNLLAAYLELDRAAAERVLRGLEIMADRAALAIARLRLQGRSALLASHEKQVADLEGELAAARQRLTASESELNEFEQQIDATRATLEQARENLLVAQAKAMGAVGDTPQARAEFRYREHQVVHAALQVALSEVRLARFETVKYLLSLIITPDSIEPDTLRTRLRDSENLLEWIDERYADALNISNRERNEANEALATESDDEDPYSRRQFEAINQQRLKLAQDTLLGLERLDNARDDLQLLDKELETRLRSQEGYLRNWWAEAEDFIVKYWQESLGWLSISLFKISDTPVTILGLTRVVLILFAAWTLSFLFRRGIRRLGRRGRSLNQAALYTVGQLAHYVIIIIGLVIGLSSIGLNFTNFALIAGALSVGIGFGLQATVSNFVSGLIILFERNLKVGDFIELDAGLTGEVKEINVRSTLINTNDNVDIVVPNSELVSTRVINWTLREAYRRVRIPFGVAYGCDTDLVEKAVLEAAERVPFTLKGHKGREMRVWMTSFGESSLDFILGVWIMPDAVKQPTSVHSAYLREIEKAFRRYDIEIPFPQRDLHLRGGFKEQELIT